MSRADNAWDNSAMESFSPSLQTERAAHKVYSARNAARANVFDHIKCLYNLRRRLWKLDCLSFMAFEDRTVETPLDVHETGSNSNRSLRVRWLYAADLERSSAIRAAQIFSGMITFILRTSKG